MRVRLPQIMGPREWLASLSGLLVCGAVYFFLIQPSLDLCASHESAIERRDRAEKELDAARQSLIAARSALAVNRSRIQQLGGSPPLVSEKELQIARITALAKSCGVSVDQYLPVDTVDEFDHQASFVQFTGRAEFAAVARFFQRLESDIEFVDATHFTLTVDASQKEQVCVVSWSCRINGMRPEPVSPPAKPAVRVAEVAAREP